jgi:hypothetical protein
VGVPVVKADLGRIGQPVDVTDSTSGSSIGTNFVLVKSGAAICSRQTSSHYEIRQPSTSPLRHTARTYAIRLFFGMFRRYRRYDHTSTVAIGKTGSHGTRGTAGTAVKV